MQVKFDISDSGMYQFTKNDICWSSASHYHMDTGYSKYITLPTDGSIDIDSMPVEIYINFLSTVNVSADMSWDTRVFQHAYGLLDNSVYGFLEDDKMKVKIGHLDEELAEIKKAYEEKDLYEFCDGILDLVYVALGTLNLMNMPIKALWRDIQVRNMSKVRATKDNMGKRETTFDVIKPEDWSGPRTKEIIDFFADQSND